MRSILEAFIEDSHLHFERLVDELIQKGVFQTKHYEIITVQAERGQKARKLWTMLLRLPPKKFKVCRNELSAVYCFAMYCLTVIALQVD
jgi:hypothetical protein